MTTYETMQSRISDELARDDLPSQIKNAIQSALKVWEGRRFFFNEKRVRLATIASQEYYALPGSLTNTDESDLDAGETLLEIDSFTVTVSGQPYSLIDRSQQWMDRETAPATTTKGIPSSFALFADEIRLSPVPDAVYECTISGLVRLGTLSDGGDTNAWMTEGDDLIRNQAKMILYRDVLRDQAGMQFAQMAIAEALVALERKTGGKVGSRIAPWGLR